MWIDLLNAGLKKEEIEGKPTPYLLNKWKALQRSQKEKEEFDEKQPSAPLMEEAEKEKAESGKNSQRWLGSPRPLIMRSGQAPGIREVQEVSPGDMRPYVPLIIYWQKGMPHVMALIDTGAEVTLINGNPKRLPGKSVIINGYGGAETEAQPVKLKLSIGKGPPFTAVVLMAEVPEYIIGVDFLLGKTIETQ
ncbi:hypothetical protein NDU88_001880 [Pleurodeles waltl]|uniref:Peptidase A2 domain-containing protein n=1 Tax=Pleurodeles waltl TaxID=8319 RepID=A0AAV7VB13_PLEWA|nr:hypothetical protein NDU88_001880 [Pleurodeles waltl]